jgi:hypothetical protein
MRTFEAHPWTWTLSVGLPIALAFAVWQWRAASRSVWRRWLVCFLLVFPVTPVAFAWSNGHNAGGVVVVPAAFAVFSSAVVPGLLFIALASLPALGLWSLALYLSRLLTSKHDNAV